MIFRFGGGSTSSQTLFDNSDLISVSMAFSHSSLSGADLASDTEEGSVCSVEAIDTL